MPLRTRAALPNNENLLGRQKKLDVPKNIIQRRPALGDIQSNIINQNAAIVKKNASHNVDVKKPVSKVQLNKNKLTSLKSESYIHVKEDKNPVIHENVIDVDAKHKGDPFLLPEYVQDIFKYLRTYEQKYVVRKGYLASHRSTSRMRSVLVNWMVEVHVSFKLLLETLHLAVAILDRYLQLNDRVGKDNLQLVGITAMVIACKYEEMLMPNLKDFSDISDNYFSRNDIKKMELEVLKKLKFNLGRPLSLQFLRRYNNIANVSPEHHTLSKYLLEIFLLQYELCHINPSLQAAAACCLSLSILNEVSDPSKVWTKTLVHYSSYKYADIKPTILNLAHFLYKMDKNKFMAIQEKYSSSAYGKISTNSKLKGPLVKKLVDQRQLKSSD